MFTAGRECEGASAHCSGLSSRASGQCAREAQTLNCWIKRQQVDVIGVVENDAELIKSVAILKRSRVRSRDRVRLIDAARSDPTLFAELRR